MLIRTTHRASRVLPGIGRRRRGLALLFLVSQGLSPACFQRPSRFLTDQRPVGAVGGQVGIDQRTVDGALPVPLVIEGRLSEGRLTISGLSRITFQVPGGVDRLAATAGPSEFAGFGAELTHRVLGDRKELFRSPTLTTGSDSQIFVIPLEGARTLTLSLLDSLITVATEKTPSAAAAARGWRDELRVYLPELPGNLAGITGDSPVLQWFSRKHSGADYLRWRGRTADEILRLLNACPG